MVSASIGIAPPGTITTKSIIQVVIVPETAIYSAPLADLFIPSWDIAPETAQESHVARKA